MLKDIRAIPHEVIPATLEVAILAMELYSKYGGGRKLHYFDSFHVASASIIKIPLVTSDEFILEKSSELGIKTINLKEI